ncbi:MAG TPA: flagellar basal body-associated FliL family protein [Miltoncostaeaceae bacterium]|nr:flagellar basal body-associated FliL family protein [Miltoncostaeaceae bacterium]
MNKKMLMIVAPLVLVILVGAGWMFLRPAPAAPGDETKVPGPTHTLAEPFVVNLSDGGGPRFVKAGVALRLAKSSASMVVAGAGSEPATLEGEAQVRDIIIRALKTRSSADLATERGLDRLNADIIKKINKQTELRVLDIYYTEFAVQ